MEGLNGPIRFSKRNAKAFRFFYLNEYEQERPMSIVSKCYIQSGNQWILKGGGETEGQGKGAHAEVQAYNHARDAIKGENKGKGKSAQITPNVWVLVQNEFPCGKCLEDFTKWSNAQSFLIIVTDFEVGSAYYKDNDFKNPPPPGTFPYRIYFLNKVKTTVNAPAGFPAMNGAPPLS